MWSATIWWRQPGARRSSSIFCRAIRPPRSCDAPRCRSPGVTSHPRRRVPNRSTCRRSSGRWWSADRPVGAGVANFDHRVGAQDARPPSTPELLVPRLSAIIITKDEARNIGACLDALAFCEERIVVDGGSTDDTCAIARDKGAQVVVHVWEGFGAQKNFALSLASGDWVLSVDADERVSPDLAAV